ncbi:MAG: PFL family protein [Candidatus Wallbacteria bacterium]|nr:PFL family protein [Candidatus Wallbacteria bacterium]MBI4866708.1 PFL family protein [Candidatus Wallbacteria bacterium]
MRYQFEEVLETLSTVALDHFDIRTVTLGISLRECADSDLSAMERRIARKLQSLAKNLVRTVDEVSEELGIPVANRRIAVTPLAWLLESAPREGPMRIAKLIDSLAGELGVNFVGGYSALVQKGMTAGDRRFLDSIPEVLSSTERLCGSVNVASTRAGINMDAVRIMGGVIKEAARLSSARSGLACAKLVVFANAPEDNPFMAGAFHGMGEGDSAVSVGISGPGVIRHVVGLYPDVSIDELADVIKRMAFKLTRVGELILREVAERLGAPRGIVDISLAPTPQVGDSVANILEEMGVERCGAPGTTAALALLNDAVKRGGAMASTHVGGLSGAFIPVTEDAGMVEAVAAGALDLGKLEAMTAVCSVGLDMVVVPGDTPAESLAGIIADEAAIGIVNNKTTAVRIIPAPGKKAGDRVEFGGLLGGGPVMAVSPFRCDKLIGRGGRFPAPLRGLTN